MIYIFLALITYSVAILLATFANRHASVSLVSLIINVISIVVPAVLVIGQWGSISRSANTRVGVLSSIIAGILISIFTLSLGKAYATNNVAIVVPIVFGGSIVLSAIGSVIFLKEKVELLQLFGLCLVVVGLAVVVYSRAR